MIKFFFRVLVLPMFCVLILFTLMGDLLHNAPEWVATEIEEAAAWWLPSKS